MSIIQRLLGRPKPATSTSVPAMPTPAPRQQRGFVVIGLGRFGSSVAETLVNNGHDVLGIDADLERVQHVSKTLPHVLQLDATNADALAQVGIADFDTGIVCISNNFEDNLLATVLLRRLGVRRVITKAATRLQKTILEEVGAHQVIMPEHEAGIHLGRRLASRHTIDAYMEIRDGMGVVEIAVPQKLCGQTLAQCNLRQKLGLNVIAVDREGKLVINPAADFILQPGDMLLVLGQIEDVERLQT
ncbi:MAG TPA: NAD-binding protein [Chloroflexota bacterium]|nr:NAD-binding protein [Chloroflexota bacterium]HUM70453.1 NAD-binding protein [Chloroflexota bacterium]